LFAVPFAALLKPEPSNNEDRYLVQDHALVYVPSLGVLKQIQARARGRPNDTELSLLAVANPRFGPNLVDVTGKPLAALPQLEADLQHVLSFYAPESIRVLKGADATLDRVLAESPSRDVVLFATHAKAFANPENSYIALADRRLQIADLTEHRLNARLAILAACETGSGRISSDGVEGLARTIVAAGADALIATLWEVPEEATGELLYGFHRAWLRDGKGLAESLRLAQIGLLKNYGGQIRLWAGFELIGSGL
jgi:CHAT domain-containing protein